MEKVNYPNDYNRVMPYLIVQDAASFMAFVKTVFDAKEKMKDVAEDGSVRHGELIIGDSIIMVGNAQKEWPPMTAGLFIYVADADATWQKAIENGATTVMPITSKDYGRAGGVLDPFGNTWWITAHQQ